MYLWVFLILLCYLQPACVGWEKLLCSMKESYTVPEDLPKFQWPGERSGAEWMESPVLKYSTGYWTMGGEGKLWFCHWLYGRFLASPPSSLLVCGKWGTLHMATGPNPQGGVLLAWCPGKWHQKKNMVSTGTAHWLLPTTGIPDRQQQGPNKKAEVRELMWSILRC